MAYHSNAHYLEELTSFFSNSEVCRDSFRLLTHMAICLAATGLTAEVLEVVEASPETALFAPLVTGLKISLGQATAGHNESGSFAQHIADRIADETAIQELRGTRAFAETA
jgi:hypothetical protein